MYKDRTDNIDLVKIATEFISVNEQRKACFGCFAFYYYYYYMSHTLCPTKTYKVPPPMESLICKSTLRMKGAAGLSGLDARGWKHLCTSFGPLSDDYCNALAVLTKTNMHHSC